VETAPEIVTRGFNAGEDGFVDGAKRIVETHWRTPAKKKNGLRRDQRKNPRRFEALYF